MFEQKCAACHAVEVGEAGGIGPSLHNIGASAKTAMPDSPAIEYIAQSILNPGEVVRPGVQGAMPAGLVARYDDQTVRSLIWYLANQGAKADARDVVSLKIERSAEDVMALYRVVPRFDRIRAGEAIFYGKGACHACHTIYHEPGSDLLAPNLTNAALLGEQYLRESIVDPNAVVAERYRVVSVKGSDGGLLQGRVIKRLDNQVTILHMTEHGYRSTTVDRSSIEQAPTIADQISPMPKIPLSATDVSALVAYLLQLNGA